VARRGGLGKGLGALIPPGTEFAVAEHGGLEMLPVAAVRPNRYQPREYFDEDALSSLAESIREVGVLQPILVRPLGEGEYEIVAGERRWRAARRVGLQTIPALVHATDDAASPPMPAPIRLADARMSSVTGNLPSSGGHDVLP